jgi:hypothetical protein
MASSRVLLARVTHVSSDVVSVCLCDTSGEDDVHIQDVLMQSGFAVQRQDIFPVI